MRRFCLNCLMSVTLILSVGFLGCSTSKPEYDGLNLGVISKRAGDWRNGAVVYQILVDRFAPSKNMEAKKDLYAPPRRVLPWTELPTNGGFVEELKLWRQEVDFYGGDFQSLEEKLDYIKGLGANVIYFNPIFKAATYHKYDTIDYKEVDPQYGSKEDLIELVNTLHHNDMKLVLDGVFNHTGIQNKLFEEAMKDPNSSYREFYKFRDKSLNENGYVSWWNVKSLPELNLHNEKVQNYIYKDKDSVIQYYLRQIGIDGWRLDVANDINFNVLAGITKSAHSAKEGSLVVGEVWNYPLGWYPSVDGIFNMYTGKLIFDLVEKRVSPKIALNMIETTINDCGMEYLLKSWLKLDNHDTDRLASMLSDEWQRNMARVLQFTLPGSPVIYYGSELGVEGKGDPQNRVPMPWHMINEQNQVYKFYKKLLEIRKNSSALRYGDMKTMNSENMFAFMRVNEKLRDTIIVAINPTDKPVEELLQIRDGRIHPGTPFNDLLSGKKSYMTGFGNIKIKLEPYEYVVLSPEMPSKPNEYDRYDEFE